MNSKVVQLLCYICLSVLFAITFFSLIGEDVFFHSNFPHIFAGTLLLFGSILHARAKSAWMKAIMARPAAELEKPIRRRRVINTILLVNAFLCGITGTARAFGVDWLHAGALHSLSGVVMFLLLAIHMLQHWGWLVKTVSACKKIWVKHCGCSRNV